MARGCIEQSDIDEFSQLVANIPKQPYDSIIENARDPLLELLEMCEQAVFAKLQVFDSTMLQ